jgi:hypothetical protein
MRTEIENHKDSTQDVRGSGLSVADGSPLRLFRVQLERTLYVLAKDAREAEQIGERNEREECGNDLDSCHATPATDLSKVPVEWRYSLPYAPFGYKEEKTVEQILANTPVTDAEPSTPANALLG